MLEEVIMNGGIHQKKKGEVSNKYYHKQEADYSGDEDYEYEMQQQ